MYRASIGTPDILDVYNVLHKAIYELDIHVDPVRFWNTDETGMRYETFESIHSHREMYVYKECSAERGIATTILVTSMSQEAMFHKL